MRGPEEVGTSTGQGALGGHTLQNLRGTWWLGYQTQQHGSPHNVELYVCAVDFMCAHGCGRVDLCDCEMRAWAWTALQPDHGLMCVGVLSSIWVCI